MNNEQRPKAPHPSPLTPHQVLNQAEVESLLSGAGATRLRSREKVSRYDPRHTMRVVEDPLRAVRTLHERFGRHFAAALSAFLRSKVEVALVGVDRSTFGQFMLGLDNPSCVCLLKAEPLESDAMASEGRVLASEGRALASGGRKPPGDVNLPKTEPLESKTVLEINPSILYPLIDRLLGGRGETCSMARRPLTEIELRLARRIAGVFLAELRRTWDDVLPLELEVIRIESDPQLVDVAQPGTIVIVIGFALTIGGARGMINLCVPWSSVERIGETFPRNEGVDHESRPAMPASAESTDGEGQSAPVELVVRLCHSRISSGELIGIEVGDIITTETSAHDALIVEVEGIDPFRVRPGVFEGRKAVRIEETPRV
ncbi:MAG TPA: FliM/FliN family flagellar motor switch protein [Pirellulales bacterium]|nr:FliM/FliN family flagellar motor switch protein [Pirellulales bacterium]